MLDKIQKKNWLKALRSGEYKQGIGALYHKISNTYCCIGVFAICNNIEIDSNGIEMIDSNNRNLPINISYKPLTDQIGQEQVNTLWSMNDKHPSKSFLEIADYIETNL